MRKTTFSAMLAVAAMTTLVGCKGSTPVTSSSTGSEVYQGACATCHGGGFKGWMTGAPTVGDKEVWTPLIAKGVDAMTTFSIMGVNKMPAKGGCSQCSDEQIKSAIEHMVKLSQ